jgi:hypothetical protein
VAVRANKITVPAGKQADFPITIRVPADARPGDHAGAVLAANAAQGSGPDGKVVTLDRRTGTRVYIRVAGPLRPELAVVGLRTSYTPSLNPGSGTAKVSYTIENRGNVRLRGTHRVSVGGPFGLFKTSTDTQGIAELLPGEKIPITETLDGVVATGMAFTKVDLEPIPIGGKPGDLEPAGRRAFSFAVPLTIIALVVVAGLLWYARRAYARHRVDEARVIHRTT